jgi:hypothetical protein
MSRSYLSKRLAWLVFLPLFGSLNAATVELAWDPSPSVVVGYYVYRSGTSGSGYSKVNSSPVANCNYKDASAQTGSTYYYVVKAVSSDGVESAPSNEVKAVISDSTVVNQNPTANAGPDQTVGSGEKVTLKGSGSDPDGDPLTFAWSQLSGPSVTLSGANSATATFTAPQLTTSATLVFRLTVSDGRGGSGSDDVSINVTASVITNQDPTADAGPDQSVRSGETVTLSGKGSDPDGDPLTFSWKQLAGPTVTLSGASSATASFTAPSVSSNTTLTFRLTVNDGKGGSATDDVNVVVKKNQAPTVKTNPNKKAVSKETVSLEATVEDPDGDPLDIRWKQISGTSVWVTNSAQASASFQAPDVSEDRELLFQISVSDGAYTVHATVRVEVSPLIETRPVFPVDLSRAGSLFENTFVGVAVMNPRWETNPVLITGLDSDGTVTSNVPLQGELAPMGQNAFLTGSIFGDGRGLASMFVQGESGPVNAFFMVGDHDLRRMDGIGGEIKASRTLYFPVARAKQDESTLVYLFNPTENEDPAVTLRLIAENGALIKQAVARLAPFGALTGTVQDIFELKTEVNEGYVRVTSNVLLKGFVLNARASDFSSLSGQAPQATSQFLVPHFFADNQGGSSEIRLINGGVVSATIRLQFFGNDAQLIGSKQITVQPGRMFLGDVRNLVDLGLSSEQDYRMVTGHVRMEVITPSDPEHAKLVGSINFSGNQGSFSSSLPMARQGEAERVFLQVAQSVEANLFTGLAILNPGNEVATVTVEAFDQRGTRTARKYVDVLPGQRVVDLLDGAVFFGGDFSQVTGHLRVAAAQPVVSFVFFGDYSSQFVAAVEGQTPSR